MSWWAKDLLTLSNLPSLPISILSFRRSMTTYQTIVPVVLLLSGFASFLFHATENGVYNISGIITIDHEVGEGWIVPMILPGNLIELGRTNTEVRSCKYWSHELTTQLQATKTGHARTSIQDSCPHHNPFRNSLRSSQLFLKIDELFAVLAVITILLTSAYSLKSLLVPYHHSLPFIGLAISFLITSDFYLTRNSHALVHSAWHVMAFTLAAGFLLRGEGRDKIS